MTPPELAALRVEIDAIDARILALLGERFRHTSAVGELKSRLSLPAVDATREAAQRERIELLAAEHGVPPELAQRLFRLVIDHVVTQHQQAGAKRASEDA